MNNTFLAGFAAVVLCVGCHGQTPPVTLIPQRANPLPAAVLGFNVRGLQMKSSSGDGDSSGPPHDPRQNRRLCRANVKARARGSEGNLYRSFSALQYQVGMPWPWPGRRHSSLPTSGSKGNYPVAISSSIRIRPISRWRTGRVCCRTMGLWTQDRESASQRNRSPGTGSRE